MKFEKVSKEEWEKRAFARDTLRERMFAESFIRYCKQLRDKDVVYDNIRLPRRATRYSAGYDFFCPIDIVLKPGEMVTIPTGIKWNPNPNYITVDLPSILCEDWMYTYLSIYPRSSLGRDYSLREPNVVSIIDSDYYGNVTNEGHIFINLKNEGNRICEIKAGNGYAQGIINRFFTTEDDDASGVRTGGFGSTIK